MRHKLGKIRDCVLIIGMIFFLVEIILAYDLNEFPKPFILNNTFTAIIIVANNASDIIALHEVTRITCLPEGCPQTYTLKPRGGYISSLYSPIVKLVEDGGEYKDRNVISIGGPCANNFTAQIMDSSTEWPKCAEQFQEGNGIIKIYNKSNKTQLIVAGYSAEDTEKAANVVANYEKYNLSGNEIEVTGNITNLQVKRKPSEYEIKFCNNDDDCILTRDGCCGCSYIGVNKEYNGIYSRGCERAACVQRACSNIGYAKCINNRCTKVPVKYCENNDECLSSAMWGCITRGVCKIINESFIAGRSTHPCLEDGNETCNCINKECPNEQIGS